MVQPTLHVYIYIYTHMYVYTCIYIPVCIYTYIFRVNISWRQREIKHDAILRPILFLSLRCLIGICVMQNALYVKT
jgi:hypothetical protein